MTNPTIEDICRRYFIRYSRLDGAIPYAFEKTHGNRLNIYIDLYGLYRTIYSRSFRTQINDYTSFTSQMVNLCSHYRAYFKRRGIITKIFLISSFNTPSCIKAILPDYNKTMDEKKQNMVISEMMNFNFDLLEIISPYLPDIFFLKTEFESSVLICELLGREHTPSLIVSTDLYPIQLCTLFPETAYIWPAWIRNENGETQDISPICPPTGHSEHELSFTYITRRKNGKSMSEKARGVVIASNYMLLAALNQYKERDITPQLINISTASKIINNTPGGLETKLFPSDIYNEIPDKEIFEVIQNRFNALDIGYQYSIFKDSLECKSIHYENLSDPDALHLINSKYFKNNPLDLLRL